MRALVTVERQDGVYWVCAGERPVFLVRLRRQPRARELAGLAGHNALEPEALRICQMLDHAQRHPPTRHNGLPEGGLVEALDNCEDALALRGKERQ